jgi:hypothetical protein
MLRVFACGHLFLRKYANEDKGNLRVSYPLNSVRCSHFKKIDHQ